MMTVERCETCRFWQETERCRRYPKQVGEAGDDWPIAKADEWCGEWKLSEAKAEGKP